MSALDRLYPEPVLETVRRLELRIAARFPDRGLREAAIALQELVAEVQDAAADLNGRVRRARRVSRAFMLVVLAAAILVLALTVRDGLSDRAPDNSIDWLPLIETTINDLVYAAIALFFLYSMPERLQRGRSLTLLHRLRSLAHVVDMHQLTKDPERFRADFAATPRSVDPHLTPPEMERYLDYCSEMLSLVGKAAALVAEESRDAVVLDAVAGIETLTTSMSRKIWQKISLLVDGSCRDPSPSGGGSGDPVEDLEGARPGGRLDVDDDEVVALDLDQLGRGAGRLGGLDVVVDWLSGTIGSSVPCTHQTGTSSGTCWAGRSARRRRWAGWPSSCRRRRRRGPPPRRRPGRARRPG